MEATTPAMQWCNHPHPRTNTHTHTHTTLHTQQAMAKNITSNALVYRVAKTHRMPYLYRSASATKPEISGSFAERDLQLMRHPMHCCHPICRGRRGWIIQLSRRTHNYTHSHTFTHIYAYTYAYTRARTHTRRQEAMKMINTNNVVLRAALNAMEESSSSNTYQHTHPHTHTHTQTHTCTHRQATETTI